jgi:hypothetical protein
VKRAMFLALLVAVAAVAFLFIVKSWEQPPRQPFQVHGGTIMVPLTCPDDWKPPPPMPGPMCCGAYTRVPPGCEQKLRGIRADQQADAYVDRVLEKEHRPVGSPGR